MEGKCEQKTEAREMENPRVISGTLSLFEEIK
jgi:hypothetical protein